MRPRKDFFLSTSRWFSICLTLLAGGGLLCFFAGCDSAPPIYFGDFSNAPVTAASRVEPLPGVPPQNVPPAPQPIRIATFNIQVFGQTKMANPEVVNVLADVIRQFDIVAVQEIRSLNQDLLPNFLDYVNQHGAKYDFVIGPRLGRTRSKEQYAYIFNTETIRLFWPSVYTLPDLNDVFHRAPLVASFQTTVSGHEPFRFTLMNIHVDPDDAPFELTQLDDAFRATQADIGGEDDVILVGDFNADPRNYRELGRLANMAWAVVGIPTNTRGTRGYDNVLFDRLATMEYMGQSGVMDLKSRYRMTEAQALQVSDHLPVWATFHPYEIQPNLDLASPAQPGPQPQR